MSDLVGNLSYYDSTGARGYDLTKPYSEKTAELMDEEVKRIVREIHDKTFSLLKEYENQWREVAGLLLEKEVIFADDVEKILGPKVRPEGFVDSEKEEADNKTSENGNEEE